MTFAAIASHSRRHAVRAFSSSSVTGILPHHHRSSFIAGGHRYPLGTALLSAAKRGESRRFSTAASDRELEVALDDLLNNNNSENGGASSSLLENEKVEEGRGRREFPKELVDVVRSNNCLWVSFVF